MSIKLMTWNVENLFLPDPNARDDYIQKLIGLADTINTLEPDIVALQEIGDPEALDDLKQRLHGSWHSALSRYPDARGIRVGFISKRILLDVSDIIRLPAEFVPLQADDAKTPIRRMGRGGLAATVIADNDELRIVTCHFKSKLISYPGGRFSPEDENERSRYGAYALFRRAAEASAIRSYCNNFLDDKGQQRPLVLMGDLNDEVQAATTQILVGPGGSEIGSAGEQKPDKGDGSRLFNIAPLLPKGERYSRKYRGRGELIDHIMLSRAIVEKIEPLSARVPKASKVPSIIDNPTRRPSDEVSDHSPVMVTISL